MPIFCVQVGDLESRLATAEVLLRLKGYGELFERLESAVLACVQTWTEHPTAVRSPDKVARNRVEDTLEEAYIAARGEPADLWPTLLALILPESYADVGEPLEPTTALPGSLQKEQVFKDRLAQQRDFHHPFDAISGKGSVYLPTERQQTAEMASRRESRGLAIYRPEKDVDLPRRVRSFRYTQRKPSALRLPRRDRYRSD